jgi:transposase
MITPEMKAQIRRLFFAEHFRIGTISAQLQVHPDTVKRAVETERFVSNGRHYKSRLDPYMNFIGETLVRYPTLRATRVHEMLVGRGYDGSVVQVRRAVKRLRPASGTEAYFVLNTMPGEQAQVDWAHFGHVVVGKARRRLYAFVMVMSWSRAIHALFTLDQTTDSFLLGHVKAFEFFRGSPRVILYDNLKSAVLQRHGDVFQFNPRLLELCAHYHFEPRPVAVARGNEKGRVERAIRFLRDRFFAARPFYDVDDLNAQFEPGFCSWATWRNAEMPGETQLWRPEHRSCMCTIQ